MAKWENKINLTPLIEQYNNGLLTIIELGTKVSEYLKNFDIKPNTYKDELIEISDDFSMVDTEDDFNSCLRDLYDLGDIEIGQRNETIPHRLAWIETPF